MSTSAKTIMNKDWQDLLKAADKIRNPKIRDFVKAFLEEKVPE